MPLLKYNLGDHRKCVCVCVCVLKEKEIKKESQMITKDSGKECIKKEVKNAKGAD